MLVVVVVIVLVKRLVSLGDKLVAVAVEKKLLAGYPSTPLKPFLLTVGLDESWKKIRVFGTVTNGGLLKRAASVVKGAGEGVAGPSWRGKRGIFERASRRTEQCLGARIY